jgi:hypothetical protein
VEREKEGVFSVIYGSWVPLCFQIPFEKALMLGAGGSHL